MAVGGVGRSPVSQVILTSEDCLNVQKLKNGTAGPPDQEGGRGYHCILTMSVQDHEWNSAGAKVLKTILVMIPAQLGLVRFCPVVRSARWLG